MITITIKEIYEYAVKHNAENLPIFIHDDGDDFYPAENAFVTLDDQFGAVLEIE